MKDGYIYMFRNKLNNKCYVGKTIDVKRRYQEHINRPTDSRIHNAITKYGIDNFDFVVLEHIQRESIDDLNNEMNRLEMYYIQEYDSYKSGYNLTIGGEGTSGAVLSEETKKAQGVAKLGDKNPMKSPELRQRVSNTLKEYYKKNPPKPHSEETIQKIRESKLGEKNPMYGKHGELNPSYGVDWTKNISPEKMEEFRRKCSERSRGDKNPMYGKSAMKGKKYPQLTWIDEDGQLHKMSIIGRNSRHPNWKLYEEQAEIVNGEDSATKD